MSFYVDHLLLLFFFYRRVLTKITYVQQLSVKTFHTKSTTAYLMFDRTYKSLSGGLIYSLALHSERVNTKFSKYFFLNSTKEAHSIKIWMNVILVLHATQTGGLLLLFLLFLLFKIKVCVQEWPIWSLFGTMSSFIVLQNDNSLSENFSKPWSLLDTMTASSHSFC